jgi:hypothetical protein
VGTHPVRGRIGKLVILATLVALAPLATAAVPEPDRAAAKSDTTSSAGRKCRAELRRLDTRFTRGPWRMGIGNPVTVRPPIAGISYFRPGRADPDRRLVMGCRLALALNRMGGLLRERRVREVEHLGIYNYRCIAGTDPCELSQHAHATAIDLHEFRDQDGTTYNVELDWIVDFEFIATCSAFLLGPKNAWLHELVCEWDRLNVFNVILTPNYNRDHRNHFHVDLTPGADFID